MEYRSPNIVDAMNMIGVVMGDENSVDPIKPGREDLFTVIRWCINHDNRTPFGTGFFEQDRAPPTSIFRIERITSAPPRHRTRDTA